MNSVMTDEAVLAKREDDLFALRFPSEKSVRYHEMRQSFYDRVDRSLKLLTLLLGSAAVLALLKKWDQGIPLYCSAVASGLSLLNLIWRASELSTRHAQLKQKFISLLIALKKLDVSSSTFDQDLKALSIERLTIEKDEPPKFCYVDIKAHNETCRAMGNSELWDLGWRRSLFANWVRGVPSAATRKQEKHRAG